MVFKITQDLAKRHWLGEHTVGLWCAYDEHRCISWFLSESDARSWVAYVHAGTVRGPRA